MQKIIIQVRDCRQISLVILSELTDFNPSWNHQKTYGFLMFSEEIKVNLFA